MIVNICLTKSWTRSNQRLLTTIPYNLPPPILNMTSLQMPTYLQFISGMDQTRPCENVVDNNGSRKRRMESDPYETRQERVSNIRTRLRINNDKRRCTRGGDYSHNLDYNIKSIANNQYICDLRKTVPTYIIDSLIQREYQRIQDSLYIPTYTVEYDRHGREVYVEEKTNSRDLEEQIWEQLNLTSLYSHLAEQQYQNDNINIDNNRLSVQMGRNMMVKNNTPSQLYQIPFINDIDHCSIIQYRIERNKNTGCMEAIAELLIETVNQDNNNSHVRTTTIHPPILEEVPDAMFQ